MRSVLLSKMATYGVSVVFLLSLAGSVGIFYLSYRDPRWRQFDFNSRQVSYGDVYNVAEVPVVDDVKLVGERTLEFHFLPELKADKWTVRTYRDEGPTGPAQRIAGKTSGFDRSQDRDLISTTVINGTYPKIAFSEKATHIYEFVPEGLALNKEIKLRINFEGKEAYVRNGLSWPDNYWLMSSSVPFGLRKPRSLDEWVGLPDQDPDLREAKKIIAGKCDADADTISKIESIFEFCLMAIHNGTPNDEMQNASPLKTYQMMKAGGVGWCENQALVYYLFANAAGVKTRLVDMAGKFGPLKLTGHYFDESWVREEAKWIYVDPDYFICDVENQTTGGHLNAYEVKTLRNLQLYSDLTERVWDPGEHRFLIKPVTSLPAEFYGTGVLAYKFGYPLNKSYSRLQHFLFYPTLLLSDFHLPRYYIVKVALLAFCFLSFVILFLQAGYALLNRAKRQVRIVRDVDSYTGGHKQL